MARKKTDIQFNEKLYEAVWEHMLNGPLNDYRASDIVAHFGAAIRSFEVNLEDLYDSPRQIAKERREHYKVEQILNNAAKELKKIGY